MAGYLKNKITKNILSFETPDSNYIFSGNTGQIFKVRVLSKHRRISNLNNKAIVSSLYRFQEAFKPNRITSIFPQHKEKKILDSVKNNLEYMTLGVTQNCNLRCKYCVFSGRFPNNRRHSSLNMTEDTAMKSADYFLQHMSDSKPFLFVSFYGGEPLLNLAVIKKVQRYISEKGGSRVKFSITTNGTLFDWRAIEYFVRNRIYLVISLDGNMHVHDHYRRYANGQPTFRKIMANLKELKKADELYFRVYVNFAVTINAGCDYKSLDEFFSQYENGVKVSGVLSYGSKDIKPVRGNTLNMEYIINKYIRGCLSHAFEDEKRKSDYTFAASVVGRGIRMIHFRRVSSQKLNSNKFIMRNHCIPGATKLFVSPDGSFFPCEKLDSHAHLQIGSITRGVDTARVSVCLKEYAALRSKVCCDCFLLDLCDYCILSATNGRRWDIRKMKAHCQCTQEEFKKAFSIYCQILEKDPTALDFLNKEDLNFEE